MPPQGRALGYDIKSFQPYTGYRGEMMARMQRFPDFNPRELPIDSILRQAVGDDADSAGAAWGVLGMLAGQGRPEAGIFLLGLMRLHGDDLARMAVLVRAVSSFPSRAAAEALKGELYRVPSTPATRTYLNEVLRSLMRLPSNLSREALETLACDKTLSVKWRRRFEEALWRY
jgi:hypothetical protein